MASYQTTPARELDEHRDEKSPSSQKRSGNLIVKSHTTMWGVPSMSQAVEAMPCSVMMWCLLVRGKSAKYAMRRYWTGMTLYGIGT